MKWAVSVTLSKDEAIENRLGELVSYVSTNYQIELFLINDIDATGHLGDQMTKRLNREQNSIEISDKELLALISEKGQIFELDLILKESSDYRFIVRDGNCLDIVGNGQRLPDSILGLYKDLDINLFL